MQHICRNWIENGRCVKCERPEWSLGKQSPFKIGDKVRPRRGFTFHKVKFRIGFETIDGNYILERLYGKEKGSTIEAYAWWELEPIPPAAKAAGILGVIL